MTCKERRRDRAGAGGCRRLLSLGLEEVSFNICILWFFFFSNWLIPFILTIRFFN